MPSLSKDIGIIQNTCVTMALPALSTAIKRAVRDAQIAALKKY
jgi:hypothetical protein